MVFTPKRKVRSLNVRIFSLNIIVRDGSSDDGPIICSLAAVCLVVLASLLPSGTLHEGPPRYIEKLLITN